jgi:hypothetical protein
MDTAVAREAVMTQAQPVVEAFYNAVEACGCRPPFKPTIRVADAPGAMRYDSVGRAVVLVPYEVLPPAQRPLNRWQAEYEANRIMVAFWRTYPAPSPAASTEQRLANFVAQAPGTPNPMLDNTGMGIEDYFNTHLAEIESNPLANAGFQKLMVRQAVAELPVPNFCGVVTAKTSATAGASL